MESEKSSGQECLWWLALMFAVLGSKPDGVFGYIIQLPAIVAFGYKAGYALGDWRTERRLARERWMLKLAEHALRNLDGGLDGK